MWGGLCGVSDRDCAAALSHVEEERIPWGSTTAQVMTFCSKVPAPGGCGEPTPLAPARGSPSHIHVLPSPPPALDLVLGAEGSEESEPGPGGPAPGGH